MTRFEESLNADLGRPVLESRMLVAFSSFLSILFTKEPSPADRMEIIPTIGEVTEQLNGVDKWSKPTKPSFPVSLNLAAMRPLIRHDTIIWRNDLICGPKYVDDVFWVLFVVFLGSIIQVVVR